MIEPEPERQAMDVDIVCVGFGPATAGFLATLSSQLVNPDGTPAIESPAMPGLPLQVVCYERADDIGFGVSGVVTRARGIPPAWLDASRIPMAVPVRQERIAYLLDPTGASRRSRTWKLADGALRALHLARDGAVELPYIPSFLHKRGGMTLSLGQFMQFVGSELMASGTVQIWPGTPVASALVDPAAAEPTVHGVRLADQGVDPGGNPQPGYLPGMDIHAALTVVGDGPVGAVGRQLDREFGLPSGHHSREWALGMKMVVELPANTDLEPGTVFHTFGFPEPEIFGFLYVLPENLATVGIFIPSWFRSPMRTAYRYLQHYMLHPYLWRHLAGGRLRSWGAKSLQESGKRGEPFLAGDGFARIGEGSGSTNVLTGSGVDEAWTTGAQLAYAVVEILRQKQPFTRENLERAYVERRRASWVEEEGRIAEKARDGFHRGLISGLAGMALAALTKGKHSLSGEPRLLPSLEEYCAGLVPADELARILENCRSRGLPCHDALMERRGWPAIPFDGQLLVSHQDALFMGGKVQAPAGFADHVRFLFPDFCERCTAKLCIEMCSGQAITPGANGVPAFDREKCVHCGACLWNCAASLDDDPTGGNIAFGAGAGGLHSTEN
jgi:electron-transferring-flavoprotein dehydrogenase